MPAYRLLQHKNFTQSLSALPPTAQRKAVWAQVLLGASGRTPVVKGTMGRNARWRRTPVQGNHYYLWWIPQSESGLERNGHAGPNGARNTILVHSVRHHDQTDQPVNLGALDDYVQVPIDTLDPRFDEQRAISRPPTPGAVNVATIKGLPGSGKTIALLYLLRDLLARDDGGRILYVTYTARLKRAAQEFVEAQYVARTGNAPESLRERLRIVTLNELVGELTELAIYMEPFAELKEFQAFLDRQNPAELGPWRAYPRTLFTEIRAYLLGRDFPTDYDWAQENLGGSSVDLLTYAEERGLELDEAEIVHNLAHRLRHMRYFRDQTAARAALTELIAGNAPDWLAGLDALVIDEVQDLTLVQIALVAELLRLRARAQDGRALTLTVAGDESQIVQPSGFDWGMTKYMLGEQIGIWPDEYEFQYQRRAPDNLAQIIDNSWRFYSHLPKTARPSAKRERVLTERGGEEELGQIFVTAPPDASFRAADLLGVLAGEDGEDDDLHEHAAALRTAIDGLAGEDLPWAALMAELSSRPGRALVDLTETLVAQLPAQAGALADEIVYLPREIKGLERHTILIHGLNDLYERALALSADEGKGNIPRFEARRLFDEMRVALSRSTNRLILLEPSGAPVLAELGIDEIDGASSLGWADLILAMQTEEMSEIEAIEGYLREVEDLIELDKWQQAVARNRRAARLAHRIGDGALQRQAERQHVLIHLQQADRLLAREAWREAYGANRTARELAAAADVTELWSQIDEQLGRIQTVAAEQVADLLTEAAEKRAAGAPAAAYAAATRARDLIALLPPGEAVQAVSDAVADAAWEWAIQLVADAEEEVPAQVAELLAESAAMMTDQGNDAGATGLQLLSERYATLPRRRNLSDEDVSRVLDFAEEYLAQLEPLQPEPVAYAHLVYWLRDTYAALEEHFPLYYRWSALAQRVGALTGDDAYRTDVLHLEQRLDAIFERAGAMQQLWDGDLDLQRFRILLAGLHGDHAAASTSWEALDEVPQAADEARLAGDMERAYQLLRQAKLPIDEELATAVKLLRLLDQVEQKHSNLRPNERAAILQRIAALTEKLN